MTTQTPNPNDQTAELVATRQAFGEALYELMKEREDVVALTADLGESLRLLKIRDEMPERFIDTGVAEANMAGVAAGLALGGYVPFAGTFGVFMTRAFDHIRVQVCQNHTSPYGLRGAGPHRPMGFAGQAPLRPMGFAGQVVNLASMSS